MTSSSFVGSIPENYDKGLGPHIFEGYAQDLAARVAALNPAAVLELAAGTGIVTRQLRNLLHEECALTASDLNEPMLEIAKAKFDPTEQVRFEQVDAMDIPYEEATFDVVACQFGVMFFPDKARSYAEVKRVLRPGGSYLFNVWGPQAANPFAELAHETVAELFPDDPPGFYKVPFGYHDQREIRRALSDAGFGDIQIGEVSLTSPIISPQLLAQGLIFGNPLFEELTSRGADVEAIHRKITAAIDERLGPELQLCAFVVLARSA